MKEKITFLSGCDYANVLTNINICIQSYSKNYDSICVCIYPHQFKYTINHEFNLSLIEKHSKIYNKIINHITQSELIILGYERSGKTFGLNIFREYTEIYDLVKNKKIINYHCCPKLYSNDEKRLNIIVPEFKQLRDKILKVIIPGSPIMPPSNIEQILKKKFLNNKVVVTHVNSRFCTKYKGSDYINRIMNYLCSKYKFLEYNYIPCDKLTFSEIVEIKKKTDIYIDQYNSVGGFGTSTIEALQYGCIILCSLHNINPLLYEQLGFDKLPIIDISGSTTKFVNIIEKTILLDKQTLLRTAQDNILWCKKYLSPEITCKNLENYITSFKQIL